MRMSDSSKQRHTDHSNHCNQCRANTSTGTCYGRQVLSFLSSLCKGRDHRPEGNIHHGICHTPEDIKYSCIGDQSVSGKSGRCCEHQIQYYRIQAGTNQQPGSEPSPSGSGLCHDHTHDRIVKGIKDTGCHQNHPHGKGTDTQDILIIIKHVAGRQHIHHILAYCTKSIRNRFLF